MEDKIIEGDETLGEGRPVDVLRTQSLPIPRAQSLDLPAEGLGPGTLDQLGAEIAENEAELAVGTAVGALELVPLERAEPVAADFAEPGEPRPEPEAAPAFLPPLVTPPMEGGRVVPPPFQPPALTPAAPAPTPVAPAAPAMAARPAAAPAAALPLALNVLERLRSRMRAQILGRDEVVDLVLVALLADGHVLLEDFPGSGKTTLAKSLGLSIVDDLVDPHDVTAAFRRIQFTPDLLPSDVTGVSIFDAATNAFHFRHGPIFAHVVLADEINRTSPKVQAAMLEAMAEKQVTVDNVTYPLDELFFVIATQNPLDLAGTYPLPVAQLDRFLFKIRMDHIHRDAELQVLESWRERRDTDRADLPKVARSEVLAARRAIDEGVVISRAIKECLVDLTQTIRDDERVAQGNSTRSMVLMLPALQALALLRGRDYVSGEDVVTLAPRVLGHRVELAPGLADLKPVLDDALGRAIEKLSRGTLRRA